MQIDAREAWHSAGSHGKFETDSTARWQRRERHTHTHEGRCGNAMPLAHKIKGRELLDEVSRPRRIENGAMREVRPLSVPFTDRKSEMCPTIQRLFCVEDPCVGW